MLWARRETEWPRTALLFFNWNNNLGKLKWSLVVKVGLILSIKEFHLFKMHSHFVHFSANIGHILCPRINPQNVHSIYYVRITSWTELNITSAPIGAWKWNFQPFKKLRSSDRTTDRRAHREVLTSNNQGARFNCTDFYKYDDLFSLVVYGHLTLSVPNFVIIEQKTIPFPFVATRSKAELSRPRQRSPRSSRPASTPATGHG